MLTPTELQARTARYRDAAVAGQWNNYEGPSVNQMHEAFDEWLDEVRAQAVHAFLATEAAKSAGRHAA